MTPLSTILRLQMVRNGSGLERQANECSELSARETADTRHESSFLLLRSILNSSTGSGRI